jgi:hypothetical protein
MADDTPDPRREAGSQPNVYGDAPTSFSQPTHPSYQPLPDNKARRTITTGDEVESRFALEPYGQLSRSSYTNIKSLREAVFDLLRARLQKKHIVSPLLKAESFYWALPKS